MQTSKTMTRESNLVHHDQHSTYPENEELLDIKNTYITKIRHISKGEIILIDKRKTFNKTESIYG